MIDLIERLIAALDRREAVALATVVKAGAGTGVDVGAKLLIDANGTMVGDLASWGNAASITQRIASDALRHLPEGRTVVQSYRLPGIDGTEPEIEVAIEAFLPPPTVVILGAGHIAVPVARIAKLLGYAVVVIDDRAEFANRDRFPEADTVLAMDFAEALDQLVVTPSTYFVLVTRGHKHDEASLRKIIKTEPAYIGMIGSRRRVRTVLRHLAAEGVPEDRLQRVYSPIGIDIGAETPEEIAVAIVAEIIKVRRGGKAKSLSEK